MSPLLPRRLLAAAALAGLLSAGTVVLTSPAGAQEASPSPSPGATASPAPAVTVTKTDSGRTVRLVPGQELVVELDAPAGEQWQGPATAGPLYLVDYVERSERTTARLQALRSQSEPVVLRARTDRPCFHSGQPCAQGFSEWSLSVVVDPGPPASGSYPCMSMPTASAAPGTVQLSEADNGRRVTVQQGKVLLVQLRGCENPYVVPSAGPGPLFRESVDYRANGVNSTVFRGLMTGSTTLRSTTDPACFHVAQPCARPAMLWSVEVEVVPASPDDTCQVPTTLNLPQTRIVATQEAVVEVRAAAGTVVDLHAYTRPATEYRVVRTGTAGSDGTLRFALRPPANTRLYAQRRGCPQQTTPVVLDVGTALSLGAARLGPRSYAFSGDSLPARPGGLVVSLYRVEADGREVLTGQARADAADGTWALERRFTGSGRFGFVARTGQDLQNAPGRSNVRPTLVY
jgi:hypothetical protein